MLYLDRNRRKFDIDWCSQCLFWGYIRMAAEHILYR